MSSTAQTLETAAMAAKYEALSNRNLLLCLAAIYAGPASLKAQQAAVTAAANHYAALSDHQLDECLLEVI